MTRIRPGLEKREWRDGAPLASPPSLTSLEPAASAGTGPKLIWARPEPPSLDAGARTRRPGRNGASAGSADPARRPPPRPTRRLATPRSLALSAVPYQPDDAGDPVAFDSRKPATVTPESSHPSYLSELMAMVHAL